MSDNKNIKILKVSFDAPVIAELSYPEKDSNVSMVLLFLFCDCNFIVYF